MKKIILGVQILLILDEADVQKILQSAKTDINLSHLVREVFGPNEILCTTKDTWKNGQLLRLTSCPSRYSESIARQSIALAAEALKRQGFDNPFDRDNYDQLSTLAKRVYPSIAAQQTPKAGQLTGKEIEKIEREIERRSETKYKFLSIDSKLKINNKLSYITCYSGALLIQRTIDLNNPKTCEDLGYSDSPKRLESSLDYGVE
jgi:hypothetical protein